MNKEIEDDVKSGLRAALVAAIAPADRTIIVGFIVTGLTTLGVKWIPLSAIDTAYDYVIASLQSFLF